MWVMGEGGAVMVMGDGRRVSWAEAEAEAEGDGR